MAVARISVPPPPRAPRANQPAPRIAGAPSARSTSATQPSVAPPPAVAPRTTAAPTVRSGTGRVLTPAQFGVQLQSIANISRDLEPARVVSLYRRLLADYSLTPAQRRRVEGILRGLPGGGGATSAQAPAPAAAPAPSAAPTPPPPAALPSDWWSSQFAADPRYQSQVPQFIASENEIARTYGFVIRRDTNQGSPTYGQALYRLPGAAPGAGNITQSIGENGALVYKDSAGNVVPQDQVPNLELDVVEVGQDQPGYTSGALGRSRMESAGRQFQIGEQAAQAGVGRSGMRAGAAAGEARALVNALGGLTTRAGQSFRDVGDRYRQLYGEIYQDLVPKAAELQAGGTPTPTAEEPAPPPGGIAELVGDSDAGAQAAANKPWWDTLSPGQVVTTRMMPEASRGKFSVKGNPGGNEPMRRPGLVYRGPSGVVWVYRSSGPDGAGWYRRPGR